MSSNTHNTKGFEETAIALLLGLMVMITFVNVVLRYVFNSAIIWGLEVTLILFAWLVLFGVSYGVKVTAHLGVDALTNMLPKRARRVVALIARNDLYRLRILADERGLGLLGALCRPGPDLGPLVPHRL